MSEASVLSPVAADDDGEIGQLEAEIATKRARVITSFDELRDRVHVATSWRHWVATHPGAWLGAGVCLGLILGFGTRRRPGPGPT